jgi:hypothetical protein
MVEKKQIWRMFFAIIQIFIAYIFTNYGRDNGEYARLFEGDGGNYLEPFWEIYLWCVRTIGVADFFDPTYGIFLLSVVAATLFFELSIRELNNSKSMILIILSIAAYQVSLVTGALRQGVSFFFFSAYLIGFSERYLFMSVITHLSGSFYLLFSRYAPIFIGIAVVAFVSIGVADLGFLFSALSRYEGYINSGDNINDSSLLIFASLKIATLLFFAANFQYLRRHFKSKFILYFILLAPVIQISIYIFYPIPIITDRVNLVLDPFILVGIVLLSKKPTLINFSVVFLFTVPKLFIRFYIAIS